MLVYWSHSVQSHYCPVDYRRTRPLTTPHDPTPHTCYVYRLGLLRSASLSDCRNRTQTSIGRT